MSFDINHGRNLLYVRGKFDKICVIVCFNKQHLLRICCILSGLYEIIYNKCEASVAC